MGNGEKRKGKYEAPRQVNSSTSQSWTQDPSQEGSLGPGAGEAGKARHGGDGGGGGGGEGAVDVPARGSRQEETTCLSPSARGEQSWQPQAGAPDRPGCRASPAAACSPPGAPQPRPRRAGTSEPRPPGAFRQRSERPSSSLIRRQRQQKAREKGRRERRNQSFLRLSPPAGIAAGLARARRSAAQRPGGAGTLVSPRAPRVWTPPPPLLPSEVPRGATPPSRIPRSGGGRGQWPHLIWGESGLGGVSPSLSVPWGLSSTPISWGSPSRICRPG
ncbi:proline-rich protein HaeIII subfamily 1-like [Camelus ferus]|uniref:Proline-rich protein HaeIII subfamily 1-like n=1 Tax=Camelus ferus TaxID=419612 RepID=A0A8B8T9B7_CAMFR|nr:proline-rich protein HaeIII subfamily 1-like [Camelus ferus]